MTDTMQAVCFKGEGRVAVEEVARPVIQEVYVNQDEQHRSRRRITGLLTLVAAGAWSFGAYRIFNEVGTLTQSERETTNPPLLVCV